MTRAPAAAARSINSAAAENKDSRCPSEQWRGICRIKTAYGWEGHMRNENKKEGVVVVELDQFKYTLNNYAQPLTELRDSL